MSSPYRSRPRCRLVLLSLMRKHKWNVQEMYRIVTENKRHEYTEGLRLEAKRMLNEGEYD